ncbi:hypothetical protein [Rhodobacter lacus]|uniref:Lipoprotein n=1 Tax=Rhodobacter lacus TaxID=1641972 RepID=A0ABW5A8P3_9RHOB
MPIRCRSELALLGLVALLAACKPGGEPEAALPPVGEAALAQQQALCEKDGGQWARLGGAFTCVRRPKDAGKACHTALDCDGACLARSMTCAPARPLLGCNEVLSETGIRGTECID